MGDAPDASWTCHHCEAGVDGDHDICWQCGTDRDGAVDPTFRPAVTQMAVLHCHACGNPWPQEMPASCPVCGTEASPSSLAAPEEPLSEGQLRARRVGGYWLRMWAAAFACSIVLLIFFAFLEREPEAQQVVGGAAAICMLFVAVICPAGIVVTLWPRRADPAVPAWDDEPTPPREHGLPEADGASADADATLVTVKTFDDVSEAGIARARLVAEGIAACVADGGTVGMAWHLGVAVGGVKLQTRAGDADRAAAILEEGRAAGRRRMGDGAGAAKDDVGTNAEGKATIEAQVGLAFNVAMVGMLFVPLHLYAWWVLIRLVPRWKELTGGQRWRTAVAALLAFHWFATVAFFVWWSRPQPEFEVPSHLRGKTAEFEVVIPP